jgi:hypothetical protein
MDFYSPFDLDSVAARISESRVCALLGIPFRLFFVDKVKSFRFHLAINESADKASPKR